MEVSNVKGQSKDHLEHVCVLHHGPWISLTSDSSEKFPFRDQRIKAAKSSSDFVRAPQQT